MPTSEEATVSFPVLPLNGMFGLVPSEAIPPGGSPDMVNCFVRGDTLRKRPGNARLGPQVAAAGRVMGLFSCEDKDANPHLFVSTETEVKRLTETTWTTLSGPTLTGGPENLFSWRVSQNSVVFSQGVDRVMRAPFLGDIYAVLSGDCPPAKYLERFADRLYLANTIESAAREPFRIRRCVNGDHTDWTGVGSGFNDLAEYPYHIRGMSKQGSQLLIGCSGALWLASRTGLAEAPARFDPVAPGAGILSGYTLTPIQNNHAYLGMDHFYVFVGNRAVEVGQQVRDTVFFSLNAAKIHLAFSITRPNTQEWLTFICQGASDVTDIIWVWQFHKDIWYPWEAVGHMCAATHRLAASRIWDSLIGGWDDQTWAWQDPADTLDFNLLITGHQDGYVYKWDEALLSDNGAAIPCRWTSRDFTASEIAGPEFKNRQLTIRSLGVVYRDSGGDATINIYFSVDAGASWGGPHPVLLRGNVGGGDKFVRLAFMYTGSRIRWKFEHISATETFRIVQFMPEFEVIGLQAAA